MRENIAKIKYIFDHLPLVMKVAPVCIDQDYFENIYEKVAEDKKLHAINPPNINIFTGLGLGLSELKHCSVLTWFMSPTENHSQGNLFMECFLKYCNLEDYIEYIKNEYFTVLAEDSYSDYGRVDIIIENSQFVFIVEAKLEAEEQDEQLKRYNALLDKKSSILGIPRERNKLFFLTLSGREPESGSSDYSISWHDISEILMMFSDKTPNCFVSTIASQYAKYLASITKRIRI